MLPAGGGGFLPFNTMQTLTDEQAAALNLQPGLCCVSAGPGSGKTHLMVERIIKDATETARPGGMVVVTFTNAAAAELRERLERRGFNPASLHHLGTLHSWASRELRSSGYDLVMLGDRDIKTICDTVRKTLGAMARNMSQPAMWQSALEPPTFGTNRTVGLAIRAAMKRAGTTHPDMLLRDFLELVATRPPAVERIYVDEYQDSAPVDAGIYETMHRNRGAALYLIGDPRQAIYGFRGATPDNLARAWELATSRAQLTLCHRSAPEVCELSTWIAKAMRPMRGFDPVVTPARSGTGSLKFRSFSSFEDEVTAAADWAFKMAAHGRSAAVLCRYNSQACAAAGVLRSRGGKVTCSADKQEQRATLEDAIALLQANNQAPPIYADSEPEAWWRETMTRLGIAFSIQDRLVDRLRFVTSIDDLLTLGDPADPNAGQMHVATIHAAKGLEWDAVWVLGADGAAFPERNPEAARMIFVACSRARTHLVVSTAESRPEPESGQRLTGLRQTTWLP